MELVERLKAKQKELGMNDRDFAKKLHVHPSTWSLIQSKHRGISSETLGSILENFPDMKNDVLSFLCPSVEWNQL